MIANAFKNYEHQMCSHGHEGLEICWSYVLTLGANESLVCASSPCKTEYAKLNSPF
ncbi:MAG: hypothetical protein KAJ72_02515 [Candidatus Heimdallarchaeota archaeon]|nr:hypothetical protein [Candidatus Heimdallarchaeota archaeon]